MISGSRRLSLITSIPSEELGAPPPKPLKKVNQYVLTKKIGCGSFSKVFLGIDANTKERYAIKCVNIKDLSRTSAGVMQLEREIRLMRTICHQNILRIHEVLHSQADNLVYLVLEYADCGSLGSILAKEISLPIQTIRSIMKQVTKALKYLHSNGFVHQDIKPANILLCSDGRALLADFGIAHSFMSAAMVVGSPAYQAPEALSDSEYEEDEDDDQHDYSSGEDNCPQVKEDVWALGITLYQLCFKKLPYTGENLFEIVTNIKETDLEFPIGTDPNLEHLIRGMLQVEPEKRLSLDEVMQNQFVSEGSDLSVPTNVDLQEIPSIDEESTIFFQIKAEKCKHNVSFAQTALSIQDRLEKMNAPYSPGSLANHEFTKFHSSYGLNDSSPVCNSFPSDRAFSRNSNQNIKASPVSSFPQRQFYRRSTISYGSKGLGPLITIDNKQ